MQHTAFEIVLAKSGRRLAVGADEAILDVVEAAGIDAPSSCFTGICGACETRVLSGVPDHRDEILNAHERAQGKTMMICCSRARTPELVLDL